MDDFISFFLSINKIALVSFLVVLVFLIYELYLLRKEKQKKEKPSVPQFSPLSGAVQKPPDVVVQQPAALKKYTVNDKPKILIALGILTVIAVAVVSFIIISTQIREKKTVTQSLPVIQEVSSAGLKVYDKQWNEVGDGALKQGRVKAGDAVYVAIKTIDEADIDRARIKVNETDWGIPDITTAFNPKLKVYYKEYTIATGMAELKIDAQLHSASDGWLGD